MNLKLKTLVLSLYRMYIPFPLTEFLPFLINFIEKLIIKGVLHRDYRIYILMFNRYRVLRTCVRGLCGDGMLM